MEPSETQPRRPRKLWPGIDRPNRIRKELVEAEARAAQLRELLRISEQLEAAESKGFESVTGQKGGDR